GGPVDGGAGHHGRDRGHPDKRGRPGPGSRDGIVRRHKEGHPGRVTVPRLVWSQPYPHKPPTAPLLPFPRCLSSSEALKHFRPNGGRAIPSGKGVALEAEPRTRCADSSVLSPEHKPTAQECQ